MHRDDFQKPIRFGLDGEEFVKENFYPTKCSEQNIFDMLSLSPKFSFCIIENLNVRLYGKH
jgi:hypothetical protein